MTTGENRLLERYLKIADIVPTPQHSGSRNRNLIVADSEETAKLAEDVGRELEVRPGGKSIS